MLLAWVKCPLAIWWTADDDHSGIRWDWSWRSRRRAEEAAVLERGGASADRRGFSEARRVGCGRGAREWRQREPGLRMNPPFAGRLAGSGLRCGQRGVGGDKLVAGGERNPEVCSDPPCRGAAGGRRRRLGPIWKARQVCGMTCRARRGLGRWRFAFPTARKFVSKKASTARSCVSCFRR